MIISRRAITRIFGGGAVAAAACGIPSAARGMTYDGKTFIGAPGKPGQRVLYVQVLPVGESLMWKENGEMVDCGSIICCDWINDADIKKRETWGVTAEAIAGAMHRFFTKG